MSAHAETVWDGTEVSVSFSTGDGTVSSPYEISNAKDLAFLAQQINDGGGVGDFNTADVFYVLTNDIYLNSVETRADWGAFSPNEWTPIGTADSQFAANFDGDGHEIYGLYINTDADYQGLFGYIGNGSVLNLGVKESYVEGGNYVGGIAGLLGTGSITDCNYSGEVVGNNYVGGIAGERRSGSVTSCFNSGAVSGQNYIGGIAGRSYQSGNTVRIEYCYNAGIISGDSNVGGILGGCDMIAHLVYSCYNTGDVIASGSFAGGIVGRIGVASGTGVVINCYNTGTVSSTDYAGGIAGRIGGGYGDITNCFNTGTVTGSANAGAIAGLVTSHGVIKNCYWLEDSASAAYPDKSGDFENIFAFDADGKLKGQNNYFGYTTLVEALNFWIINNQPSSTVFLFYNENASGSSIAVFDSAQWYILAFDLNGAAGIPPAVKIIRANERSAEPDGEFTRGGYIFNGWYKDNNGDEEWQFDSDVVSGNITLFAIWIEKDFQPAPTISLDSKTTNSITLTAVSGAEYSRNGSVWQASNIFENLSPGTDYLLYIRMKETDTLAASALESDRFKTTGVLKPVTDANSLVAIDAGIFENYVHGDPLPQPIIPNGFEFIGWEKDGQAVTSIDNFDNNITLKPVWSLKEPIVAIADGMNGSGQKILTATVTAYGGISYSYQWYVLDNDEWKKIENERTEVLIISKDMAGKKYKCEVKASAGNLAEFGLAEISVEPQAANLLWLWIMLIIIGAGGVGFAVWYFWLRHKFSIKKNGNSQSEN